MKPKRKNENYIQEEAKTAPGNERKTLWIL